MQNTLQMIRDFYVRPGQLFEKIAVEKNIKQGLAIWLLVLVVSYAVEMLLLPDVGRQMLGAYSYIMAILLVGLVIGMAFYVIGLGVIHLSARLCGGVGEFKALLICSFWVHLASLVTLPIAIVFQPVEELSKLAADPQGVLGVGMGMMVLGLAVCFWMVYLLVLAIRKCYELSWLKATLALFLPMICFIVVVGISAAFFH